MDNAELLSHFENRVDEFDKIQGFIEKAQSQASKFAAAVVEKVIKTNTEKGEAIVEELIPLMSDMDGVVEGLEAQKAEIVVGQQQSKLDLEELELRLLIQELTDKEFEKKSSGLKKELEESNGKIGELDTELDKFRDQLNRWQELGQRAGVLESGELDGSDLLDADDDEELSIELESVDSPEVDEEDDVAGVLFDDAAEVELVDVDDGDMVVDDRDGTHAEKVSVTEDLSDVIVDDSDDSDDSDESDESDEFDDSDDSEEIEVGDESDDEIELEMGEARQAVLIYSEGNDDEQVYPFVDDVLRLGRGRDNDIQVKNDSKVSRYHCRVVYKEDKYFIEDNKSANGTLVDGATIGEQQLFGGEELTIGETIFHFRLMA
jgi:hypothetical protein